MTLLCKSVYEIQVSVSASLLTLVRTPGKQEGMMALACCLEKAKLKEISCKIQHLGSTQKLTQTQINDYIKKY